MAVTPIHFNIKKYVLSLHDGVIFVYPFFTSQQNWPKKELPRHPEIQTHCTARFQGHKWTGTTTGTTTFSGHVPLNFGAPSTVRVDINGDTTPRSRVIPLLPLCIICTVILRFNSGDIGMIGRWNKKMPTQNHHWFPFSLEIPKQIHPVIPYEDVGPSKNLLEIARGAFPETITLPASSLGQV